MISSKEHLSEVLDLCPNLQRGCLTLLCSPSVHLQMPSEICSLKSNDWAGSPCPTVLAIFADETTSRY